MSKRFFVDDEITAGGKYRVLQEDSVTKERFGVKDFDTREEAQRIADEMQKAVYNALSEKVTLRKIDVSQFLDDNSNSAPEGGNKDKRHELKHEISHE